MQRKKLGIDLDGVVAAGGWVPVEERSNKTYFQKPPVSPYVVPALIDLSTQYDLFFISSRGHKNANLGARAWLHFALGLEMDTVAGVITHPWDDDQVQENPNGPMDKGKIVRELGIAVHIDDDPRHVEACGDRGVLFVSDMPSSRAAAGVFPTVHDWDELMNFLMTPGYTLHGSNGVSVVSPCEAIPVKPILDPETVEALAESLSKRVN